MRAQHSYKARHIKRLRSSAAEVQIRRQELYAIVEAMRPMTVRQVFYQATVRGIVEKTEAGYAKVQTDLVVMRKAGDLPYGWLADNTRWQRRPRTYDSIEDALKETARLYRKSLRNDADPYVEIWLEKDALSDVIYQVTALYDVPLMVARGYASQSFLHTSADYIKDLDVPVYIYHLGDFDPSGVNAGEKIEQTLTEMAPGADIYFQRIAVTEDQINSFSLPTRPTKASDTRSKGFGDVSVHLDAMAPATLRAIVEFWINRHLPADRLSVLQEAEKSERELLKAWVGEVVQ